MCLECIVGGVECITVCGMTIHFLINQLSYNRGGPGAHIPNPGHRRLWFVGVIRTLFSYNLLINRRHASVCALYVTLTCMCVCCVLRRDSVRWLSY